MLRVHIHSTYRIKKNIVPVHVVCIARWLYTERWDFPQLNFKYNKP